jgi:hypothetical protein
MDGERKVHSNSVLKNLPPLKQAEIMARLETVGETQMDVARWLVKENIPASEKLVGNFRKWYSMREDLWEDEDFVREMLAICKERGWVKTAREERAAAQMFFNRLVLRRRDPRMWSVVERVNLVKDKVGIEEEKLELQKRRYDDKKAKKKKNLPGKMTDEEKEAAIREIYGMEPVSRSNADENQTGTGLRQD